VYRLDDGYGAAPSVALRWREGGTVYHQHYRLQIECFREQHGIVRDVAFIWYPINSSYHLDLLMCVHAQLLMFCYPHSVIPAAIAQHAASVTDHVWTVYAHRWSSDGQKSGLY